MLISGENIFQLINKELTSLHIPWGNCLALGSDNAYVMTGNKKGLYAFMKAEHKKIYLAGCTLHVLNNAAKKAAAELPNFDEVLVDIYHFFKKSSLRQAAFKGDQELCGIDQKKMLKHVVTRWLSITR